jgi:TatD DNase family protein
MIAVPQSELVDIGVNLTHESFAPDLHEVMARAGVAGVGRMIVTGTSVSGSQAALNLQQRHPAVLYATAGVHPHHATELTNETFAALTELAAAPGVVAVGECGLDYYRNYSPRETQIRAFKQQLELAHTLRKPVFLHQRDAHSDFIAILREYRSSLVDGVAHCFTGQSNELMDCLDLGLAIGITGWICDERRGQHLLPLMSQIPSHRLMLETDSPYLLPRSLKPKPGSRRNEPAYLAEVAKTVAQARQDSYEELARSSTQAAVSFFKLEAATA